MIYLLFVCFVSYLIPRVVKNLVMKDGVMNKKSLRSAALEDANMFKIIDLE